ncbi:MAG: hypothetical protein ABIH34_01900 [Nanoarchaeota archaeon]
MPEKFFEYLSGLLSQPLQPLLDWTKSLMTAEVNIGVFAYLWVVIIYILSMLYGLLIMWAGFNFIISGYDAVKRERAKSWFRNVIVMMVLVQSSFFLYEVAIDVNASMTAGVFDMIDQDFFTLQADNIGSFALELIFFLIFVIVLVAVLLVLLLRYAFVCIGVVFVPLAIFFYFIPFLKNAGQIVLSLLSALIFLTFLQSLVILGGSLLVGEAVFQDFHIVVLTVTYLLVILMTWLVGQPEIKDRPGKKDQPERKRVLLTRDKRAMNKDLVRLDDYVRKNELEIDGWSHAVGVMKTYL